MPQAAPAHPPSPALRFGPAGRFELRPAEYRLLVDGQPAALGSRALDLLIALATRPAELLSKSTLFDLVWPGVVVEENNLRVQINSLRRLLGDEAITTVPGRGYRFSASLQDAPAEGAAARAAGSPAEPAAPAAALRPLPQRLFGRDADLAALEHALQHKAEGGCTTLVGTAGVGKSSLARVAMARWAHRAAWVDLAALTQAAQVAGAVARALDVPALPLEPAALALQLQQASPPGAPLLLVLDNAEHLVAAVADCVAALSGLAALRLLVTSQLPLAVRGERVQRLEPLQLPGTEVADAASAADPADLGHGALALLVDRITAADRRFSVTPAARPLLAALCVQLDGLPLALEMAAARVPMMGLQAVHDALAQRFALLSRSRRDAPTRHRTLHDALDWSYRLLGPTEQRLLAVLAVFAGGFTLDLALAVAAETAPERWDVLDRLATLVDRSLVHVDTQDPPRYRLLQSVRDFALQQLTASADSHTPRQRHASAVLALLAPDTPEALRLAEMENAREAFAWASQHDLGTAIVLSARAAAVSVFTVWRQETTDWMQAIDPTMQQLLAQQPAPVPAEVPAEVQADWWTTRARMLNLRRQRAALAAARHAVALWRPLQRHADHQLAAAQWVRAISEPCAELDQACAELRQVTAALAGTPRELLRLHGALAEAALVRGDFETVLACRLQEVEQARALPWPEMMQAAESNVCYTLGRLGRHAEAAARGQLLLQRVDADGGDGNGNLPWVLNSLIHALVQTGALVQAQALAPRAITACRRFNTGTAWATLVLLATAQRRFQAAAKLAGHVPQLFSNMGWTLEDDETEILAAAQQAIAGALGATQADALMLRGRLLDDAQALALATGEAD